MSSTIGGTFCLNNHGLGEKSVENREPIGEMASSDASQ